MGRSLRMRLWCLFMALSVMMTMLPPALAAEEGGPAGQSTVDQSTVDQSTAGQSLAGQTDPLPGDASSVPDAPEPLTAPAITAAPLDEDTGEMVLAVEGEWDSYAWESCRYGQWSPWEADGPTLTLSKADFVAYGFRCTVTSGEQSVTSQVYAYDEAVLERPSMAPVANAGNLQGQNSYMWYGQVSRRFDIRGLDDDGGYIRTTFSDAGYRTAISVNNGSKVEVRYQDGGTSVGSSLTAETNLSFAPGGHYVQITYTVTNNGSTTQSFQIGSSADVMIGDNDRAGVSFTSNGLKMEGSWLGLGLFNNYDFYLVAPTCDTLWYGYYADAYQNMFTNRDDDSTYRKDSGMAWSWNGTVAPGQTWTRSVLIGAGEVPEWNWEGGDAPRLAERHPVLLPGEQTTITGTSQPGSTVTVSVGGVEFSGVADATTGEFSIPVTLPEDYAEEEVTVQVWAVGTNGGVSDVTETEMQVTTLPKIELTTTSVTVMEDTTLAEGWYETFIDESRGDVQCSGTVNTAVPGTYTITYTATVEDLPDRVATADLSVTVQARPAQLSQTTAEESGEDFTLTAAMVYPGGETWTETGFVYGAIQNPTLNMNDGIVQTSPAVSTKGGTLTATVAAGDLTYGITYYVRAYAKSGSTVIYGAQTTFGLGVPDYGTFSVAYTSTSGDKTTFTITRDGTDGEQTVYYRTVNGSAIGGTHFTHQAGELVFKEGETEKTVTVTENSATMRYNNNPATAYSSTDRVYSLEIYRVTGGATINPQEDTATRTMTVPEGYRIPDDLYDEKTTTPQGQKQRGDYDVDRLGWDEENIGSAAIETVAIDNTYVNYWANTSVNVTDTDPVIRYWVTFDAWEENSGYQAIQILAGQTLDTRLNPESGGWNGSINSTNVQYAAIWEHGGTGSQSSHTSYRFPADSGVTGLQASYHSGQDRTNYVSFPAETTHITTGLGASGSGGDRWVTDQLVHHYQFDDADEPQILGVAPMAGGVYEVGDEVTISLVFNEIVDADNSTGLTENMTEITTNWGTFTYAGGAGTNVLYFTGTVSESASGSTITVYKSSLDSLLGIVKDMCAGGTASTGSSAATDADLAGTANRPTVAIGEIGNSNGTLSAGVTVANAAKLEYVWSQESAVPAYGWTIAASGTVNSTYTFTTRQSSGTWYLHVRATNSDGIAATATASYTFPEGGTALPSIAAQVDNTDWARAHTITVTAAPGGAQVSVTGPGIDGSVTLSGTTYTAAAEGVYTFTMAVDGETYTAYATVTNIDNTAPAVTIQDPTNTSHTQPVTLTVAVADGQSGVASVTGTWRSGEGETSQATLTLVEGQNGVYTTTSPETGGAWTLTVTAADGAGNTGTDTSSTYTVNLSAPTIQISGPTKTDDGYVYTYTIAAGDSSIAYIQLPDGTTLASGDNGFALSGSLTLTEPGDYALIVTDAAGHVVTQTVTISEEEDLDAVAPDVRLSADIFQPYWVRDQVTVTVSVYEAGSVPAAFTYQLGNGAGQTGTLTADGEEEDLYEGTFTATENGTYTVAVTDGSNVGEAAIVIDNIDKTGPTITVASGDPADWTSGDVTVTFTVADSGSGVDAGSVQVTDGENNPVQTTSNSDGSYSFTVSTNGTYTITAKDSAGVMQDVAGIPAFTPGGNTSTQPVTITKIDKSQPNLTVNVTDGTDGSLTASVSVSDADVSGITVTVKKDDGDPAEVEDGSYIITGPGTYTFTAATGAGLTDTETVTVRQVTFASAYGTQPAPVLVVNGERVADPGPLSQTGYTFWGWFAEQSDTAFDFNTSITQSITLTARWTLTGPGDVSVSGAPEEPVRYGTGVTLTAVVGDHPAEDVTYTYQWYRGTPGSGTPVPDASGGTLALTDVAHSGSYYVVVTAVDSKGLTSAPSTGGPVTVTIQPAPVAAPAEDTSTFTYNGGEQIYALAASDAYTITGAVQTNAGSHTVTAALKGPDNYVWQDTGTAEDRTYPFVIAPKELTVTWTGLTPVYDGSAQTAEAILSGLAGADTAESLDFAIRYDGERTDAGGSCTVTAVLSGAGGSNYVLRNATAVMTVQKRPVHFTVSGNAVEAGGEDAPIITTDPQLPPDAYTITYRKDGLEVQDPTQPGEYEIWAELEDDNYQTTGGGSRQQIGTLIISARPPVLYQVTFAPGAEGAIGDAPGGQLLAPDSVLTLPASSFTYEGHRFTGWSDGTTLYQPGETYTLSARDVTFTAQWQTVFEIEGTVAQQPETDGWEPSPVQGALVVLMYGAQEIARDTTDPEGGFGFDDLIPGTYNLVTTYGERVVTTLVTITNTDEQCNAVLPAQATNSLVSVTGSTPVVVGNLETAYEQAPAEVPTEDGADQPAYTTADQSAVQSGGKVELTLSAAEKEGTEQDGTAEDMEAIREEAPSNVTLGLVMDYTLTKAVTTVTTDGSGTVTDTKTYEIPVSNVLLELRLTLPAALQGMDHYSVYRRHGDGEAETLTQNPAEGEEGFTVAGNILTIYARKFSTYVVGYANDTPSGGGSVSRPTYPPVVEEAGHGSVTVSPLRPERGDTVTVTLTPDPGYVADQITVTDQSGDPVDLTDNGDGTWIFIQPVGRVTVSASFRPADPVSDCPRDESCPMYRFTDVDLGSWYHDGIHFCLEQGLMGGTGADTFAPTEATTRGMLVTILWHLEGSPQPAAAAPFSDVAPGAWYDRAVAWASASGLVAGYGDGTFAPERPITREELVTVLHHYAQYKGYDVSVGEDTNILSYLDAAQISDYAFSAMQWACGAHLISGIGGGLLNPGGQATRAEAATILMHLCQRVAL